MSGLESAGRQSRQSEYNVVLGIISFIFPLLVQTVGGAMLRSKFPAPSWSFWACLTLLILRSNAIDDSQMCRQVITPLVSHLYYRHATDNISPVMGIGPGEVGALNDPAEPRHLGVTDGGVVKLEAPTRVTAIRSEST